MKKMSDKQSSDAFLQKVMSDTRTQAMQADNMQMMLQSLHMTATKDLFVGLARDKVTRVRSQLGGEGVDIANAEFFDPIATVARLAADRLMVALGATVTRPEPAV